VHFTFLHEIPMFSNYEVRISIAGWDNKWVRTTLFPFLSYYAYPEKFVRSAAVPSLTLHHPCKNLEEEIETEHSRNSTSE
jgi:hypothetical protein